jgi:hypothetical protein
MFLYLNLPRILSSVFACRHGSVGAQLARIDEETYKRCESINRRRSNTRSQTYKQEPSVLDPRSRENYANGSNYRSVLGVESKSAVVIEEASRSRKSRAHGEWASAHVTFGAILSNKEWSPRQR